MPYSTLRVLHTIADINMSGGGAQKVAVELSAAQGAFGAAVHLVSQKRHHSGTDSNRPHPEYVQTHLVRLALDSDRWRLSYSPFFGRKVKSLCRQEDIQIIHEHGMWLPSNHAVARVAHRLGLPLVIQAHGMLAPWALSHRAWKKQLAWLLYQRQDLESASIFVATSSAEAEAIRRSGLRQPIAIIPLGIHLPVWEQRLPRDRKIHSALFLSRIHPVKGLLNLVAAWGAVRPRGWRLIVAGQNDEGHLQQVQDAVHDAGLKADVEFVGHVSGMAKEKLYREADLFILPSFSENFGIVIAEALSYGVPVITTRGTPWQALVTHGCGWWVEIGKEPLVEATREATSLSDDERYKMGQRGRNLVEDEFSWPEIAIEMLATYDWVRGIGTKPTCVLT